jgi:hypothetical protein
VASGVDNWNANLIMNAADQLFIVPSLNFQYACNYDIVARE